MQINKHNYEAYFLDFWESSLDVNGRKALSRFLEENPDLQDEFLDFKEGAQLRLTPDEEVKFSGKVSLKKPVVVPTQNISADNYEDYIIAELESDLSAKELQELKEFRVKNPQLIAEFNLYSKTILKPDQEVNFAGKAKLKKLVLPQRALKFTYYFSVAAAVLLFALLIVNPFERSFRDEDFNALTLERTVPTKPIPIPGPEIAAEYLGANNLDLVPDKIMPRGQDAEILARLENEIIGQEDAGNAEDTPKKNDISRQLTPPEKIETRNENALLTSDPLPKRSIVLRTEMVSMNDTPAQGDDRNDESRGEKERSAFGRLLTNLGNQILGNGEAAVENSLVGQIAGMGKERFTEIRENAPKLETVKDEDSKKTYFTINDNLRIRISKDQ